MGKLYTVMETPWGYSVAVWSDAGLWEVGFPKNDVEKALADIQTTDITEAAEHPLGLPLTQQLKSYFKGFPIIFDIPIDWSGYTPFQAAVLRYTNEIGYGKVETYGQVAQNINHPKASRAVGGALHINRTPIVVPCHRVIGSNGSLTGFGGGVDMKAALLLLENNQ